MNRSRSGIYFFIWGALAIVTLFIIVITLQLNGKISTASESSAEDFPQGYKITSPDIPNYLEFAGEKIPTDNFEVFERIEREFISNTYFHSATVLALKRATRWFPVIEPILKKNNIPDDFKYLCVAESNMDNVVSPAGATGFWQFMKPAGEKYGLEINSLIDERYNVEKSTEAACKYLKDSYDIFGNWILSAASYNMGSDGVVTQMERQKVKNYFNLVLNSETSRFVSRIVSLKYILQNPEAYGFEIKAEDKYNPLAYYEIKLDSSVSDFADYAKSVGVNYFILKMYNPWLRDNYLDNKTKQVYLIKLPTEGSIEIIKD
ncbi:MAG: lytic transglycosylase domain-containing protein [Ignavibacteriales bacterium]